jgi:hypothetical protein
MFYFTAAQSLSGEELLLKSYGYLVMIQRNLKKIRLRKSCPQEMKCTEIEQEAQSDIQISAQCSDMVFFLK